MADVPIRCAVVTVSDRSSAGIRPDLSGPALVEHLQQVGWTVLETRLIPDELETIKTTLLQLANAGNIDIILTTGGTGFAPRDVTPEATMAVIQKNVPGLPEVMRSESRRINAHAILSRGCAGIFERTLIINLPGSPKAAVENLDIVLPTLPHAILTLRESPGAEPGHLSLNKE